jgi:hypothetical protein
LRRMLRRSGRLYVNLRHQTPIAISACSVHRLPPAFCVLDPVKGRPSNIGPSEMFRRLRVTESGRPANRRMAFAVN